MEQAKVKGKGKTSRSAVEEDDAGLDDDTLRPGDEELGEFGRSSRPRGENENEDGTRSYLGGWSVLLSRYMI